MDKIKDKKDFKQALRAFKSGKLIPISIFVSFIILLVLMWFFTINIYFSNNNIVMQNKEILLHLKYIIKQMPDTPSKP